MNRKGFIVAAALAIGVALVACEEDTWNSPWSGSDPCAQYTSCAACTPVMGCGWCYNSDGTGACADEPNDCSTSGFTWTWDPSGCRQAADASVTDGPPPPAVDASSVEAGSD